MRNFFSSLKWGLKKTWNEKRKLYNTTTSERHSRKKMDIFRNIGRFSHCTIFCTLWPILNFCWVQEIELHTYLGTMSLQNIFLKVCQKSPKNMAFSNEQTLCNMKILYTRHGKVTMSYKMEN